MLIGKPQKIEIRGHSSRKPLPAGSEYRNFWELSYARCLATMQYLHEQGIAPERMRLSQAGVYEPEPSLSGHEPAQQSRVEVHLLDEVATHFMLPKPKAANAAASLPPPQGKPHAAEPHAAPHPEPAHAAVHTSAPATHGSHGGN